MNRHIHFIVLPPSARLCNGAIQNSANEHDSIATSSRRGGQADVVGEGELIPPSAFHNLRKAVNQRLEKHDKDYTIEGWRYRNRPNNGSNRIQTGKYEDEN